MLTGGDNINIFLKNRIKHALLDKGWKYKDLAEAVGCKPETITNYMCLSSHDMPNVDKKVKEVLKLD